MSIVHGDTVVVGMLAAVLLVFIIDLLVASGIAHTLIMNLVAGKIATLISGGMS